MNATAATFQGSIGSRATYAPRPIWSIDSIRRAADEQVRATKEQAGQAETLHANLLQAQERIKVMDEAIKARDEALKVRDGKLKEYSEALTATRKRLDEAIAKLKEAR